MLDNIDHKFFPFGDGAKILDIGSALGDHSIALKQAGCQVSALEIDPNLVEKFKKRPEAKGIEIKQGDARKMPYEDSSFDGAILLEVIEHIPGTEQLLSEIQRVLKPGGVLCIAVPTSYTEKLYWRLHSKYASNATHFKIFSKNELRELIKAAGLEIRAIQNRNFVAAVSWTFHAALHSNSDHTGAIHEHLWVDRMLDPFFRTWSKTPVANKGLGLAKRYIGKSWYIYAQKPA